MSKKKFMFRSLTIAPFSGDLERFISSFIVWFASRFNWKSLGSMSSSEEKTTSQLLVQFISIVVFRTCSWVCCLAWTCFCSVATVLLPAVSVLLDSPFWLWVWFIVGDADAPFPFWVCCPCSMPLSEPPPLLAAETIAIDAKTLTSKSAMRNALRLCDFDFCLLVFFTATLLGRARLKGHCETNVSKLKRHPLVFTDILSAQNLSHQAQNL